MRIILDMGSGNTCKNDTDYVRRMIDAVMAADSRKHEVILKWQLFDNEPPNIPLHARVFNYAYSYAEDLGYKTTSSVFDYRSLRFLLGYKIPFVKIACRPRLYGLVKDVPRGTPVYLSIERDFHGMVPGMNTCIDDRWLTCVPKYPAALSDYIPRADSYVVDFSDHTQGLELFREAKDVMKIWEKHFILEDDPNNPDAAGHAIKPDLLKEALNG